MIFSINEAMNAVNILPTYLRYMLVVGAGLILFLEAHYAGGLVGKTLAHFLK